MINRRQLIAGTAGSLLFGAFAVHLEAQGPASEPISVTIDGKRKGVRMPSSFTGLSFETGRLSPGGFFTAANTSLIAFLTTLSPSGILRIGGNSSDFSHWAPDKGAVQPPPQGTPVDQFVVAPQKQSRITTAEIDDLAAFSKKLGWKVIYGLNLTTGSPAEGADEALYVVNALGSQLVAIQIGNEPDLNHLGMRPAGWNFDIYFDQWSSMANAVRQRAPAVTFAGPDTAGMGKWVPELAAKAANQLVMLTTHNYPGGSSLAPNATIDNLLRPKPASVERLEKVAFAAKQARIPVRMSECNSFSHGGKAGVSDTLAAALWAAEYMLVVAGSGFAGVNFHTGQSPYSAIHLNSDGNLVARPLFYGMLFAQQFAGAQFCQSDFSQSGTNSSVFAATKGNRTLIALFNKDKSPVSFQVNSGHQGKSGRVWRLAGPDVAATSGVTLAGSTVGSDGSFRPTDNETVTAADGKFTVSLPPYSAALITI
jgi:hypothetical protein